DVCDREFVQAVTAASDGCKSALQAIKFLKTIGFDASAITTNEPKIEKTPEPITAKVIEITNQKDFEKYVLASKKPVVIDLFTTWCIPCQTMAPLIDKLAAEHQGSINFVKINASIKTFD